MGCRSGYPEGNRACLGENDPGNVLEFAADQFDKRLARRGVRLAAFLPFDQQGLYARCSRAHHSLRPAIEEVPPGFTSAMPSADDRLVVREVGSRPGAEWLDQPKRMPNTCEPRDRLRVGKGRICNRGLCGKMKHRPWANRDKVRKE